MFVMVQEPRLKPVQEETKKAEIRNKAETRKPLRGLSRLHSMRKEVELAIEEGLSARQLADRFKVSRYSVAGWLKETGNSLSDTTEKQRNILTLWYSTDMNTAAIAKDLSCARTYVTHVLKNAGLVQHTNIIGRPPGSLDGRRSARLQHSLVPSAGAPSGNMTKGCGSKSFLSCNLEQT
jgi:predicted DNA-binding protein YlxM (UPF0122 family)